MSGLVLWVWQYSHTGPRLTDQSLAVMRATFDQSMARRAGYSPAFVAVDMFAPDPQLTDPPPLPLMRVRLPGGHAAFVLEHELES